MNEYYDRYEEFKADGTVKTVPGIFIKNNSSDKKVVYKSGSSRLDKLSQEYYNNPYHGWLILSANPQFGGLEFNIPDQEVIRIPFPFNTALERYIEQVKTHILLYGE